MRQNKPFLLVGFREKEWKYYFPCANMQQQQHATTEAYDSYE